jgi:hypothetical protein
VTVAAALAACLRPNILQYCVFAHRSAEQAHRALLNHLEAQPLLDLACCATAPRSYSTVRGNGDVRIRGGQRPGSPLNSRRVR